MMPQQIEQQPPQQDESQRSSFAPPAIPVALEALHLSPEAFRVFLHLCTRARPALSPVGRSWAYQASLDAIAQSCFGGSQPDATAPALRRKTYRAIAELETKQALHVARNPSKRVSNTYFVLPPSEWQIEAEPQAIASEFTPEFNDPHDPERIIKSEFNDPDAIFNGDFNDPLRITYINTIPYRSLEIPISSREREINARAEASLRSIKTQEEIQPENRKENRSDRETFLEENQKSFLATPSKPEVQGGDKFPPAAPSEKNQSSFLGFDWQGYNWQEYGQAGDGGSDPGFWDYTLNAVRQHDARKRAEGEMGVGDIPAYARACIRKGGKDRYRAYLFAIGVLQPDEALQADQQTQQAQRLERQVTKLQEEIWGRTERAIATFHASRQSERMEAVLRAFLRGNADAPPDPERVEWLLGRNPQWGFRMDPACGLVRIASQEPRENRAYTPQPISEDESTSTLPAPALERKNEAIAPIEVSAIVPVMVDEPVAAIAPVVSGAVAPVGLDERLLSHDLMDSLMADAPAEPLSAVAAFDLRLRPDVYPWKRNRRALECFVKYMANAYARKGETDAQKTNTAIAMIRKANFASPGQIEYVRVHQSWLSFVEGAKTSQTEAEAVGEQSKLPPALRAFMQKRLQEVNNARA